MRIFRRPRPQPPALDQGPTTEGSTRKPAPKSVKSVKEDIDRQDKKAKLKALLAERKAARQ